MLRRSTANLPLHTGQAPRWLFQRMQRLAGAIVELIVIDFGPDEMLKRLADPHWFQAFGCVLGFDWHSSGLTTVTCGALAQAYKRTGSHLGIHVAGGKGKTSRQTPRQISQIADRNAITTADNLIHASKLSAKVDSAALQDGYQLYHHCFFFDDTGRWAVVQQGMNDTNRYARRYHWYSSGTTDFVNEPHAGIITDPAATAVLNLVADEARPARHAAVEITRQRLDKILAHVPVQDSLFMPTRHSVVLSDNEIRQLHRLSVISESVEINNFEQLLGTANVGATTVRALALLAELVYDAPASKRDPARYSFAHGGKDGHPFPVERQLYDKNIARLEQTVARARINPNEKDHALRRLARWAGCQR